MRQKDDALFATALNNLAVGQMTPTDIALFQSRTFAHIPPNLPKDIMRLFGTNESVDNCNNVILNSMSTEEYTSYCYDKVIGNADYFAKQQSLLNYYKTCSKKVSETMDLSRYLLLKIGAWYMVTINNLDTSDGLINGTNWHFEANRLSLFHAFSRY